MMVFRKKSSAKNESAPRRRWKAATKKIIGFRKNNAKAKGSAIPTSRLPKAEVFGSPCHPSILDALKKDQEENSIPFSINVSEATASLSQSIWGEEDDISSLFDSSLSMLEVVPQQQDQDEDSFEDSQEEDWHDSVQSFPLVQRTPQGKMIRRQIKMALEKSRGPVSLPLNYLEQELSQKEPLSSGSFGETFLLEADLPEPFVLKRVKAEQCLDMDRIKSLLHANILPLQGYHMSPSNVGYHYLLYPHPSRGSLQHVLATEDGRKAMDFEKRSMVLQGVAEAMKYLVEEAACCNRHLKTSNILVSKDWTPQIEIPSSLSSTKHQAEATLAFGMVATEVIVGTLSDDIKRTVFLKCLQQEDVGDLVLVHHVDEFLMKNGFIPADAVDDLCALTMQCMHPVTEERPAPAQIVEQLQSVTAKLQKTPTDPQESINLEASNEE